MAVTDVYELAYREAVRALDHQLAALTELRSRAGMLLATASITVSLLGREAFAGLRLFAWLAIACFVLLSVCVLAIVWPRTEWRFESDVQTQLAEHLANDSATTARFSTTLIAQMAGNRLANARHLTRIAHTFRIGACLLAIQILATVAAASTAV
jgi:hypothetical protein